MSKSAKPTGLSPAERELAAHIARIQGNIRGGRNRWKGTTKAERSAKLRAVRLAGNGPVRREPSPTEISTNK